MKTIIGFEGLGNLGYLKNGLFNKLKANYSETFEFKLYKHHETPKEKYIFMAIGHSLGGASALKWAEELKAQYCVTLDPRRNNIFSWFDTLLPIQKPFPNPNVETYNFYRHGFMPGYEVIGANNRKFKKCSHGAVPAQEAVMFRVTELMQR